MKSVKIFLILILMIGIQLESFSQGQNSIELANQYAATGEFDKAVVYFEKWYNSDPYNAYPPYLNCLIALKDYDKAEKLIKKQIKKNPAASNLWVDLGNLYEIEGKENEKK